MAGWGKQGDSSACLSGIGDSSGRLMMYKKGANYWCLWIHTET